MPKLRLVPPDHLYKSDELAVYEYVECGAWGHALDYIGGLGQRSRGPSFGELVTLRCMRCGTERYDIVQRESRELLQRSYNHPPGYRFAKGKRPKRLDFVLMSIDETKRKRVRKPETRQSGVGFETGGQPTNAQVSVDSTTPKRSRNVRSSVR